MQGLSPVRSIPRTEAKTPLKRWQHRRNTLIVLAHESGVSQRMIADVFDLSRKRVQNILKEYREKYGKKRAAEP